MGNIQKIPWFDADGDYHTLGTDDYYISTMCEDAVLFVEAPDSPSYYASSLHLKRFGENYMPHHDSEPAFITYNRNYTRYHFFNGGVSCMIEDLPCDDETKCILILKYEFIGMFNYMMQYKI